MGAKRGGRSLSHHGRADDRYFMGENPLSVVTL